MKKMQAGGVTNESFREEQKSKADERKSVQDAQKEAQREAKAQKVYNDSVKKYEREQKLNPDGLSKSLTKGLDNVGDVMRSVGKTFGSNRMTSMDDDAQMQARKDVKGYKSGGSVSSASKRADGIAIKGKTRGKMC